MAAVRDAKGKKEAGRTSAFREMADLGEWLGMGTNADDEYGVDRDYRYLNALRDEGPFIWLRLPEQERRRLERKFSGKE